MCYRNDTWLSETRRDVPSSSLTPAAAVTTSPASHQVLDANHNNDNTPANKWVTAAGGIGDVASTPSASPAVSELIDKGVVYLRDRIFNRDSGKQ